MKKALITGQDGACRAEFLLKKTMKIMGLTIKGLWPLFYQVIECKNNAQCGVLEKLLCDTLV